MKIKVPIWRVRLEFYMIHSGSKVSLSKIFDVDASDKNQRNKILALITNDLITELPLLEYKSFFDWEGGGDITIIQTKEIGAIRVFIEEGTVLKDGDSEL